MRSFILNEKNEPVEVPLFTSLKWHYSLAIAHGATFPQLRLTQVTPDVAVSTIFIATHFGRGDPKLFETAIVGGPRNMEYKHHATFADANSYHVQLVLELSPELPDPPGRETDYVDPKNGGVAEEIRRLRGHRNQLYAAIKKHHEQKADDRCWMDDDELYAAAGLDTQNDNRCVGDKTTMLKNCQRFIDTRCQGGVWSSYVELEEHVRRLRAGLKQAIHHTEMHNLDGTHETPKDRLDSWTDLIKETEPK